MILEVLMLALISSGTFCGDLSLDEVLSIGMQSIVDWVKNDWGKASTIREIHMAAYSEKALSTPVDLLKILP